MRRTSITIALVTTLVACGGGDGDGDAGPDGAAETMDGGSAVDGAVDGGLDAAAPIDAAPEPDAATTDAGEDDAGTVGDAGSGSDAGTPDGGAAADAGTDAGSAVDAGADGGIADAGTPIDAGGGCTSNADCPTAEFCRKTPGDCGGVGSCDTRPGICPLIFAPVCGCDATTYSNSCMAASAGVNVLHDGACGSSGCPMTPRALCCFDDADCGSGTRCEGANCAAGQEGTCVDDTLTGSQCWNDDDCPGPQICRGASRCPCGATCLLPDSPGTCGAP